MPLFEKLELKLLAPFYLAEFLTGLSMLAQTYMFLYFARDLGLSFVTIAAIVFVAFFGGTALFEIPSGIFADIYGRKRSVLLGSGLLVASTLLVPFLNHPLTLGFTFFLMGVGAAFRSGANEAWPVDNLHHHGQEHFVQDFQGKVVALRSLGMIFGPLLAAFLVKYLALRWLFAVDAAFFFLALLPLWLTHEHGHKPRNIPARHFYRESKKVAVRASRVIFRQPILRLLFFALMVSVLSNSAEPGWQPLFLWTLLPLAGIGVVGAFQSLVRVIVAPLSTLITKQIPHSRALGLLSLVHLLLAGLLFFTEPGKWWWAAIVYIGIGILVLEQPIFFALQQRLVPSRVRATVISFFMFAFSVIGIVGMLIGGIVLDLIGPKYAIMAMALFTIPEMLLYFGIREKVKQR
jgi:MFS family permease